MSSLQILLNHKSICYTNSYKNIVMIIVLIVILLTLFKNIYYHYNKLKF